MDLPEKAAAQGPAGTPLRMVLTLAAPPTAKRGREDIYQGSLK